MTTDKDIAQALKTQKATPSKEWQDATIRCLRAVSSENPVTESAGMRTSLGDAKASLASYFIPPFTMNPVALKTIGSLAAVCVITAGTHVVADSATPENTFLYALDRGFERAEIALASIGGRASAAQRHLIHADERATEIDVLLRGEASASLSLRELFIETAHAQSVSANAQLNTHVALLVDDCRDSLTKAVDILEEIADSASTKARAELATAIEMTSKSVSQRLEASVQITTETDVRPVVRKAIDTAKDVERKARRIQARVEGEVEAGVEAEARSENDGADTSVKGTTTINSNTKGDTRSIIDVDTETAVETSAEVEIDVPAIEFDTNGGLDLNVGTRSKRRGGGGSTTTHTGTEAKSETNASATTESGEEDQRHSEDEENTGRNEDPQETDGSIDAEVRVDVEVEVESSTEIDIDTRSNIESQIDTNIQSDTSL